MPEGSPESSSCNHQQSWNSRGRGYREWGSIIGAERDPGIRCPEAACRACHLVPPATQEEDERYEEEEEKERHSREIEDNARKY